MITDYRLPLMNGIDIPIPELQLTVHVPTIKEIAYMGEQAYFSAVQYICLEKEILIQDETISSSLTNFQVLMKVLEQSKDKEKQNQLITLLKFLFPDYNANFIKGKSIILTSADTQPVLIDDSNFDILQNVLKEIFCIHSIFQKDNIVYNPQKGNKKAEEIAQKIARGKMRVAQIKSKEASNESILTRYQSILAVANIAPLSESSNYNIFQLFDLMERYNMKIDSDVDLQVRLTGAQPEKPVESWMKDLHSLDDKPQGPPQTKQLTPAKGMSFQARGWTPIN